MTAIALKPAVTAAAPGSAAIGLGAAADQSQGARAVPDPRVHRADHHLLLDVAAALPAPSGDRGRGMSFLAIGFFASVPNLFGMAGNVVGGM